MYIQFRKYAALFLLVLFVFPFVEKGIHDFEHAKDIHCFIKNSTHFHTHEHHCEICDFTVSITSDHEYPNYELTHIQSETLHFYFYKNDFLLAPAFSFSLRGPPLA
jgi:hypothetical protein